MSASEPRREPATGAATTDVNSAAGRMPQTRASILNALHGHGAAAESAWGWFFEVYGPVAYRFGRRSRLSEAEADDVVANVMRNLLVAFRRGFEKRESRGRFRAYFRTVVNNEISAAFQRRGKDRDAEPGPPPLAPDSAFEREDELEQMRLCLRLLRLAPSVRARDVVIFERYVLHGDPPEKLAREFGVTRSRVYAIKHEVTKELRAIRAELEHETGRRAARLGGESPPADAGA